jgi:hypothetical protein
MEVLFAMDPGQVVEEQVVRRWPGLVPQILVGILVEGDDQYLDEKIWA